MNNQLKATLKERERILSKHGHRYTNAGTGSCLVFIDDLDYNYIKNSGLKGVFMRE